MSIIVLTIRGFHLGYLGCYGNEWIQTPNLDELASQSAVFDWHFANVPAAAAAERSWRDGRFHFPAHPPSDTSSAGGDLLDVLREQGIPSALVTDLQPSDGRPFQLGWDHVATVGADDDESKVVLQTIETLSIAERWLLWIDLHDLLPPWNVSDETLKAYFDPPDSDSEEDEEPLQPWLDPVPCLLKVDNDVEILRLQNSYAAAVTELDARLGKLWDVLCSDEVKASPWLVLTSDAGFPLGEHGMIGAVRPWLHDELVHVPLMILGPEMRAGFRVEALTQSTDLMPTLLDALAVAIPDSVQGQSLLRDVCAMTGRTDLQARPDGPGDPSYPREKPASRGFVVMGMQIGEEFEHGLRTAEWAYLSPARSGEEDDEGARSAQLYVKPEDRWEVNNVIHSYAAIAGSYEPLLRELIQNAQQPGLIELPPLPIE